MKKVLVMVLVLLVSGLVLAGCGGSGDALKGTWIERNPESFDTTWTFDGNGNCTTEDRFGGDEGTYTIEGNNVSIKLSYWQQASNYTFSIDGSILSLTAIESYLPDRTLEKQ